MQDAKPPDLVVLVPGIRTQARWQNALRVLLRGSGFSVELTNFGYFDLFRFLMPARRFRRAAIQSVWKQLQAAQQLHPNARVSIIAHSFGTHIIAEVLRNEFSFRAHRVIFCGSVVPYDFPFEQILERFTAPLLNEVGTRDYLPILADSVTWGYGSAGAFGFRRPPVEDRWHSGVTHSAFLKQEFCAKYWIPFLHGGVVVPGAVEVEGTPWWVSVLSKLKIKYVLLALLAFSIIAASVVFVGSRIPLTFEGNVREVGYVFASNFVDTINRQLAEPCRQSSICESLRGRRCMTVTSFDSRLRNLVLCKDFSPSWLDPVDGLRELVKATVPPCIDLTVEGRALAVRLNEREVEPLQIPGRETLQLCQCSEATKRSLTRNLGIPVDAARAEEGHKLQREKDRQKVLSDEIADVKAGDPTHITLAAEIVDVAPSVPPKPVGGQVPTATPVTITVKNIRLDEVAQADVKVLFGTKKLPLDAPAQPGADNTYMVTFTAPATRPDPPTKDYAPVLLVGKTEQRVGNLQGKKFTYPD